MVATVRHEASVVTEGAQNKSYPWTDFVTVPRARRAIVFANIVTLLNH